MQHASTLGKTSKYTLPQLYDHHQLLYIYPTLPSKFLGLQIVYTLTAYKGHRDPEFKQANEGGSNQVIRIAKRGWLGWMAFWYFANMRTIHLPLSYTSPFLPITHSH